MKNFLLVLGIIATIGVGTYLLWENKTPETDSSKNTKPDVVIHENNTHTSGSNGFSFSSGGVGFICNQNFNFTNGSFKAIQPIGDSVNLGIRDLKEFLDKHPNKTARITGLYLNNEENSSAFTNLGVARANDVKNYFVSKGIPSNRLALEGENVNEWDERNGSVIGPIHIDFLEKTDASQNTDWLVLKKKINKTPLQLNFESGEAAINLSNAQREMIMNITKYLDNVDGSMIQIIGHTDNVGSRQGNIDLGQDRADFAKAYLVSNGVSQDRIETSSLGPDQPIADNSQDAGRSKNRRTVVLLK